MMAMKPLVKAFNLQKDVIYTIQKKKYNGPYCEIELEDVRIKVPIQKIPFQRDFIRYNGQTIEFLRPTCKYCFCDRDCEKCACSLIPTMSGLCMCIFEYENTRVYNFQTFIKKINTLLDNFNTWCEGCLNYVWNWDLNHVECGIKEEEN